MDAPEAQGEEFIIPTRYRQPIGSHLSWPVGARELTKELSNIPQVKELQITFAGGGPKWPKGKEPTSSPIIEARFSYNVKQIQIIEELNLPKWSLTVYPVARSERAEVKKALVQTGFKMVADWLIKHSEFENSEGDWEFKEIWNSKLKELTYKSRDYVLPEVSSRQTKIK